MFLANVPGGFTRANGECERHGAVAVRRQAKIELTAGRRQRGDGILSHPRDHEAASVAARPACALLPRGQQLLRVGSQRVIGPGTRVEQVVATGESRIGQQFVQRRQCSKHDSRQVFRRVPPVDGRELAYRRIDAAQRKHRRKGAVIRSAQLHDTRDAFGPLAAKRESSDETAHAVSNQHDRRAVDLGRDAPVECVGKLAHAGSPVVRMHLRIEPCDPQRQFQLQRVEQHRAECDQPRAGRQGQASEVTRRDFDQVDPQHVVEQQSARADARSHQAGQHVDANAAWTAPCASASRQGAQFTVALVAEERREFCAALTRREQSLDLLVVESMHGQRQGGTTQRRRPCRFRARVSVQAVERCPVRGPRHSLRSSPPARTAASAEIAHRRRVAAAGPSA